MRIIAKRRLFELAAQHGDLEGPITDWYRIVHQATWTNLVEVRALFPHADRVGDKTVFNIKGNNYRLIVHINYQTGIVYVKQLLTHAEYDRGAWKE